MPYLKPKACGSASMNYSISNTAEYGEYVTGPRIVTADTKAEMKRVLEDIQSGRFVRDFVQEIAVGAPSFKATRRRGAEHQIEEVGQRLRAMMPWITKNALGSSAPTTSWSPSPANGGGSHQAQRLETGHAVAADHQVIMDSDAQGPGGLDDLAGHVDVGGRGGRV
eukprot:gene37303-50340_t